MTDSVAGGSPSVGSLGGSGPSGGPPTPSTTTPGTPAPGGSVLVAEPGSWPADKVADILSWAGRLGIAGVEAVIDMIQDCLGHPEVVHDHAWFWVDVEDSLKASRERLQEGAGDMEGFWEGIAYESFMGWKDRLADALSGMSDAAEQMREVAQNLLNHVVQTYNSMLDFIVETHAALLDAVSGLVGAIANLPTPRQILVAVAQQACAVLAAFERNVKDLLKEAVKVLTGYKQQAVDVASAKADIRPAPSHPDRAWKPRMWNPSSVNG